MSFIWLDKNGERAGSYDTLHEARSWTVPGGRLYYHNGLHLIPLDEHGREAPPTYRPNGKPRTKYARGYRY